MKILRINTRTKSFKFEELGELAGLGGRALTSRVVNKEVPANCHPLSAENKLIFAAGVLAPTNAANSGRISVGAKSPLTGGIKESNSGGQFAHTLPKLDLLAVILEDKPEAGSPMQEIFISADKVVFKDSAVTGMRNYAAQEKLLAAYGDKAVTALIGPAGEQCLCASTIQFSDPEGLPSRSAGRGGLGAVMGSKGVKAIILDGAANAKTVYGNEELFKEARKEWVDVLRNHPVTSQGLPGFGTAVLVNVINEAGALPTKNFRMGKFDGAEKISGETLAANIEKRGGKVKHGCHTGCVIQCSQVYHGADGKYLTTGFEYETIWGFGANLLIDNLDDIAAMDRTCDEVGVDTIEMANTMAMAMEGGTLSWGDSKGVLAELNKVGTSDPLGRIYGNGTSYTAKAFGVDRIPVVKNQSLPAYDPRAVKGVGVTYATTPMGADHTAGYGVCQNVLKVGGDVDGHKKEGNIEISKNLQIATAAVDSLGLCLFVAFAILDDARGVPCMAKLISGLTGKEMSVDEMIDIGVNCLKDELDFNKRAGFTDEDDQLPRFFREELLAPHNVGWGYSTEELQAAKV
ncbi:MAG: aldehyde ferredoxin oxidoreductase C-terminal domain-containing protein [Desulfomicrobium apsheronum]|nr:aldehyde ferredoxin oxidoreductase C-terminal domain-containing protein [Desulfomicrobium apsheronum]